MNEPKIEVGTIVCHPNRPDWGPGKALILGGGGQVTVYFRDIEEKKAGDAVKTLATKVVALEIAADQSDSMLDNIPPFTKGRFEGVRKPRLSLDHAVQALIDAHPGAFGGPAYVEKMRSPVMTANQMWMESFGDGRGNELLDSGKVDEVRRVLLEIGDQSGLLTPDEKRTFSTALEDGDAAGPFFRALFEIAGQESPEQASFQRLIDALAELPEQEGGTQVATWPVLTQFPFVACPEHHIQLRPAVLQKCASRLNFDLRSSVAPNWWTYDRLIQMARIIFARLKPLGAKDLIDVQSMIRVIAAV